MGKKDNLRTMGILTHILVLFTGFIGPLIIFLITKDKPVKEHAKNALNWSISFAIYWVATIVLMFVMIGFLLVPVLIILNFIFPIIAAVKASNDEIWKYPLSIPFLK